MQHLQKSALLGSDNVPDLNFGKKKIWIRLYTLVTLKSVFKLVNLSSQDSAASEKRFNLWGLELGCVSWADGAALGLAGAGQGWALWFRNPKSCAQGDVQDECSSQGIFAGRGRPGKKNFGMKIVHLDTTVFPTLLTKLILVKWRFPLAATWEVYLFPLPKKKKQNSHF